MHQLARRRRQRQQGKPLVMDLVLAYLITPSQNMALGLSYHDTSSHITLGSVETNDTDEELFHRISEAMLGKAEDTTVPEASSTLPFQWYEREMYDTTNPFAKLGQPLIRSLWTFDMKGDRLLYRNEHGRSEISISALRRRVRTLSDFKPLSAGESLRSSTQFRSGRPHWQVRVRVDERIRVFIFRLLRDFSYQWRHVFRNEYNSITLRALARAILLLSTLRFDVVEDTKPRPCIRIPKDRISIVQLPTWRPFETEIICVGKVYVVISHSLQEALAKARRHLKSQSNETATDNQYRDEGLERPRYMLLSLKQIALCRVSGQGILEATKPETLFDQDSGTGPSDLALDYLLWAITSARLMIPTRLQRLPVEIQDEILKNAAVGTVGTAKIGCIFGIGSNSLWKEGACHVGLLESWHRRDQNTPVESQIWFGIHKSGLAYKRRLYPSADPSCECVRQSSMNVERRPEHEFSVLGGL